MRSCVIVPVCTDNSSGFMWRWRTLDGSNQSAFCFTYFHDCLEAAQQAGFSVDMKKTQELAQRPETVSASSYRIEPRRDRQ